MAYRVVVRRNGTHVGELGPYASKVDADSDARLLRSRMAEADVSIEPAPRPNSPQMWGIPEFFWKKKSKETEPAAPPKHTKPSAPPAAPKPPKPPYTPPPLRRAAGGFVTDANGLILLREPKNHFDGYVWTFPKGGIDPGESDEQGAIREVEEEAGVKVRIVAPVPGEWKGGTSTNRYFLMDYLGELPEGHDEETEQVAWVTYDEAKAMISETKNKRGRERDLEVLDAGYALWLTLRAKKG